MAGPVVRAMEEALSVITNVEYGKRQQRSRTKSKRPGQMDVCKKLGKTLDIRNGTKAERNEAFIVDKLIIENY